MNQPSLLRGDEWELDLLGNWSSRVMAADGAASVTVEHAVNDRNEIDTITATPDGGSPESADVKHDAAGNLMFDGTFAFQYDAWSRLVQVNAAHLEGEPSAVVLDGLVKHFTYDGLGRLARVQSPYPFLSSPDRRSERLFYDGIRRIQEVTVDPVDDTQDSFLAGGGVASAAALALELEPNLDASVATLGVENAQFPELDPGGSSSGGGGSSQSTGGGGGGGPPPGVTLAREYIWGPGGSLGAEAGGGVDELLVQYDATRTPTWPMQDAGLDVVALADLGGSSNSARTVWHATYDAYGSVLGAESLHPHAPLRAGHKGLFFDRLDADVVNPSTGQEHPRLAVGADILGYARNRHVKPSLGRWLQRDPNASGQVLMDSAFHGGAMGADVAAFDFASSYGDGANVYQYLGTNTFTHDDPLGLFYFWGPEDAVMLPVYALRGGLEEMIGQYADNMLADVEWALDWDMDDDWHTRSDNSWVMESFARGVRGGFDDWLDSVDPREPVLFAGFGGKAAKAAKAGAKVFRSARQLNRLEVFDTKAAAKAAKVPGEHTHHLVERQVSTKLRLGDGPMVNIPGGPHLSEIRIWMNEAYRKAGIQMKGNTVVGEVTLDQARRAVDIMYKSAPRLRNAALRHLKKK